MNKVKRVRDVTSNSAHVQAAYEQLQFFVKNNFTDVLSRIFLTAPGRKSKVSFGVGDHIANSPGKSHDILHFGSYNYSGLNGHPRVVSAAEKALKEFGTTVSGVRLLNGTCNLHIELERRLAKFLGTEDCITFSSGYLANVSVISALCCEDDVIFSDMLNHRSIADGLKLSGAEIVTYRHNNYSNLESQLKKFPAEKRKFIITDGVFSMGGEIADLPRIIDLAEEYNAFVLIDDAHATAAIGPLGRGTAAHFGLEDKVDVVLGSLSKGLPGVGGFAAGPKKTIDALRFGSNGYVFSASIPPAIVAGLIEAIDLLVESPDIQDSLHKNEKYLRDGIHALGLDTMGSESPIIPIAMPSFEKTLEMSRLLQHEGIYINPVGYPAVSKNRCRLRINVSANMTKQDLDTCLDAIDRCTKQLGIRANEKELEIA